jgi:hypothetical protein
MRILPLLFLAAVYLVGARYPGLARKIGVVE